MSKDSISNFVAAVLEADEELKSHRSKLMEAYRNYINETSLNILIVGATGSGKSTTIKALFRDAGEECDIEVKGGGLAVTKVIKKYEIGENFVVYDSPGLGDGSAEDAAHTRAIQALLREKNSTGDALIDLVLVIVNAAVGRDLGSTYKTVEVVAEAIAAEDRDRILIAINKCDQAPSDPDERWDYEANQPSAAQKEALEEMVAAIKTRLKESANLDCEPIYYAAGHYSEKKDKHYPSYNLPKLLDYLRGAVAKKSKRKVAKIYFALNDDAAKGANDGEKDYKKENEKGFFDAALEVLMNVAKTVAPFMGGVVGAALKAAIALWKKKHA